MLPPLPYSYCLMLRVAATHLVVEAYFATSINNCVNKDGLIKSLKMPSILKNDEANSTISHTPELISCIFNQTFVKILITLVKEEAKVR